MILYVTVQGFVLTLILATTRDDVYLEIVKTIGIAISAGSSLAAVWIATRYRRPLRRIEEKVDRQRHKIRAEDTPGNTPPRVVIEEHNGGDTNGQ